MHVLDTQISSGHPRDGRHAFLRSHTATGTLLDAVVVPTSRASNSSTAAGRAAGTAISSEADGAVASNSTSYSEERNAAGSPVAADGVWVPPYGDLAAEAGAAVAYIA